MVKSALNAAQIFPKACNYCPNANFANTFKLCKNPSSYKANFNSCFPSPTQYKQKAATAEYRNRTSESEGSHSYPMIKYCLQTFIYQKSICNFRPQWRIYHKLEISHICRSEIKVLPTIRALIHIVSIYNSSLPKGTAPVNPASEYLVLVQKIVCTQAQETCCMIKENTNARWH